LFFGRLADLYGRKKAFMIGTLCQIAFSLGCGFAQGARAAYFVRVIRSLTT
jgi:MFS family permease